MAERDGIVAFALSQKELTDASFILSELGRHGERGTMLLAYILIAHCRWRDNDRGARPSTPPSPPSSSARARGSDE